MAVGRAPISTVGGASHIRHRRKRGTNAAVTLLAVLFTPRRRKLGVLLAQQLTKTAPPRRIHTDIRIVRSHPWIRLWDSFDLTGGGELAVCQAELRFVNVVASLCHDVEEFDAASHTIDKFLRRKPKTFCSSALPWRAISFQGGEQEGH